MTKIPLEIFFAIHDPSSENHCWVDLGEVWGGQIKAKNDFWEVFFRCFFRVSFGIDFLVIFSFFLYPNLDFCAHSQCFVRIFAKLTFSKNMEK